MKKISIALVTGGLVLASCVAYGGPVKLGPEYKNYPPYDASFYERFLSDRAWVFHNPDSSEFRDIPHGMVFHADGRVFRCFGQAGGKWTEVKRQRWSVVGGDHGAMVKYERGGKAGFVRFFYDPETGSMDTEVLREKKKVNLWTRPDAGWVQDSWPRVLADACPDLELPAGMAVNDRQTANKLGELREQDPSAPVRHFPGSGLTGPGRTGLAASGGKPTTTKAEVWTFLNEQEGNVLLGPEGHGRVFVRGQEGTQEHEVWGLGDDGAIAWTAELVEAGEWLEWKFKGKVVARYPMGYPVPYVPTGHRYQVWQLTDKLITDRKAVSLSWMGRAYRGHLFEFHADKRVTATGPDASVSEGKWRWTRGRLEVSLAGDEDNAESIAWGKLAREMSHEPVIWTRSTPNAR